MSEDAHDSSPVDPGPKSPTGNPFPPKPQPVPADEPVEQEEEGK